MVIPGLNTAKPLSCPAFKANCNKSVYTDEEKLALNKLKKDYQNLKGENVLLLFSGGFDTSFLASFFKNEIGANVHALSFELGDQRLSMAKITEQAQKMGIKHHVMDITDEFVNNYVKPAIFANAKYNHRHPLSSSLSRPLMMKKTIEQAQKLNCKVIMQGTSPMQNNAPRFQKAFDFLKGNSDISMQLPILKHNISRELEKKYLNVHKIKIEDRKNDVFSADGNIFNWEAEDGKIQKLPFYRPNLQLNGVFNAPKNAPETPERIFIGFEKGVPTKLGRSEKTMHKCKNLTEVIKTLNKIGGKHGVGIHDAMESRPLGFKQREIHVAPAADILITAHEDLEQTVMPDDILDSKQQLDNKWTKAVCNGDWYRDSVKYTGKSIKEMEEKVTGIVGVELYKGHIDIIGRKSPYSLDSHTLDVGNSVVPSETGFKESAFLSSIQR